jgi:hypothetical protein
MFRQPKPETPGPQPDPNDVANRRNTERRHRTMSGGRQSTVLATAMNRQAAAPTATLTGVGG